MARFARLVMAACALLLGAALPAFAQMPEGTLVVSATPTPATAAQGESGTVEVEFVLAEGHHIYGPKKKGTPTTVRPLAAPGITFGAPVFPKPLAVELWGEATKLYRKKLVVKVPYTVAADAKPGSHTLTFHLGYMVCTEAMCYDEVKADPITTTLTVTAGPNAPPAAPEPNPATPADPAPPAPPEPHDPAPPIQELPGLPGGGNPEEAAIELLKVAPAVDGVALTLEVTEGWHFFSFNPAKVSGGMPSKLKVTGAKLSGLPKEPATKSSHGAEGYFEGRVTITLPLVYDKGAAVVEGELTFQLCDPGACVDRTVPISFPVPAGAVTDGEAVVLPPANPKAAAAGPSDQAPDTAGGDDDLRNKGLGAFLVACVLGGLFSLIMPCVYPLIPVTVTFFAKQAGDDGQGKTVGLALVYGAGIIISFTGLGLLLTLLLGATGANDFANNPWVNLGIAAVFLYLALALFGLVPLELPQSVMSRIQGGAPRKGFGGAFILGLLFTVVTFTCVVPVAGSLMVIAAQDGDWVKATVGMLVYSTTMALPFMAFGLFPAVVRKLPLGGGWMHTVKVTGGFIELALVVYYVFKADFVWHGVDELYITRGVALSVYAATAFFAGTYLLGLWRLPGDHAQETISVPRMLSAMLFVCLGFFMVGGLAGRDLGSFDIIVPPDPKAAMVAGGGAGGIHAKEFSDWESGIAEAKATGKPVFLEFTGGPT